MHSPRRYAIHLEPDLTALTFRGSLRLTTVVESSTRRLDLDAVDLSVAACTVSHGGADRASTFSVGDGVLAIELDAAVEGEVEISIEYTGEINDLMAGFYRSRYTVDGNERFLAVTQFEERDARRAFPCVDRPAYKAVFDIEILAPKGHIAIANTPEASVSEQSEGARLYRFEPTPPMSTYLVFFGVGPFDIETDESWRVPIRVAVSPGKGAAARASLEYARQSVSYLEEFTGVEYPLGKLDSIGVTDFAYGAMENFGAIVYRENYLLTYPESTTRRETERMMGIAAHEIAHQWFGDLVSPADWRYVWLNEAFATFFGNVVADHWYPQWRTMDQFVIGATSSAMGRDGLPRSVPIELESDDEVEIDASTAPIVYSKGASILRMVRGFYGDEAFRAGTRAFLDANSFAAADTEQFLSSFGPGVAGSTADGNAVDPAVLLERWIRQPGVPLVRVFRSDAGLTLKQERFSYLGESDSSLWAIPVTIRLLTDSPSELRVVLDARETQVEVDNPGAPVKVNIEQTGYYRVFYESEADWSALGRASSDGLLSPLDRYGVVSDLAAFVTAGLVRLDRYLQFLTTYFAGETEFVVLSQIAGSLVGFLELLGDRQDIRDCIRTVLEPVQDELLAEPSDDEPYRNVLLRDSVLWTLYRAGSQSVAEAYGKRFAAIRKGEPVHPDLFPLSVRIAFSEDPSVFSWITDKIESDEVPEGRTVQLIAALSAVRDEKTTGDVLDYILTKIPDRNRLHFLRGAAASPTVKGRIWDWFVEHFDELSKLHPSHLGSTIASVVPGGGLGREEEVKAFLERYRRGGPRISEGVIDVSLDRLEINRRFVERESQ